jgi:hypothetical protein
MRPAHDDPVIRDPHVIASCRRGGRDNAERRSDSGSNASRIARQAACASLDLHPVKGNRSTGECSSSLVSACCTLPGSGHPSARSPARTTAAGLGERGPARCIIVRHPVRLRRPAASTVSTGGSGGGRAARRRLLLLQTLVTQYRALVPRTGRMGAALRVCHQEGSSRPAAATVSAAPSVRWPAAPAKHTHLHDFPVHRTIRVICRYLPGQAFPVWAHHVVPPADGSDRPGRRTVFVSSGPPGSGARGHSQSPGPRCRASVGCLSGSRGVPCDEAPYDGAGAAGSWKTRTTSTTGGDNDDGR